MSLPPPFMYLSKSAVPENSPTGRIVGTFVLIDGPYHVELVDDAGGRFAIDDENHLIVTGPLDYEAAQFQSIKAQALQGDTIIMEDVFLIQIEDVEGVSIRLRPLDSRHGTREQDKIVGSYFADKIGGRGGDDNLHGRAGDDILIGGLGQDRLTGNRGADHFVFHSVAQSRTDAPDIISDFHHRQGDRIDLNEIAAKSLGEDTFDFIGNAGFGGHAGELRFDVDTHLLEGDIDGDGSADFAIQVNVADLSQADLLL